MAKNKIITSQGNVQFINSKGRTINMHPMHCYAVYEGDTVSFLFIYMKDYSGQAFFASQYEDLEVNGESYDNMEDLKAAINYAFAKAGAQARTEIVDELPEDPFTNTIYLLPKEHGEGYDEYIWNEDEGWQLIGDTDIEFERYLKIDDFNPYSATTKDYIDAVSGETVANHNDIVALSGAIDTEISARTDADTALSGAIDSVTSDLADEVSARTAADTTLQNNINTVNGRVDAEQIARAQADTALSGAIDSVSGAVDTEVSARTAADEALDSKIDTVSGDVISETSRAEGAEIALGGRIDDEITARTAADTALDAAKADKVNAVASAEYDSGTTTINFKNISGTVISSIDASDFIKDGMIEDVRIETISGVTYLVIDFNTASGIEDIKIPLTDFFNPDNYYDKTAIDNIVSGLNDSIDEKVAISDFNTYSGAVETELASKFDASAITAYSTSAEVSAEIEAAVSGKADASDLASLSGDVVEDERVLGESINDLNTRLSAVTSTVGTIQTTIPLINGRIDAVTGDVATLSSNTLTSGDVQTQIDSSISGKVDTTAFTSYSASVETALSGKQDTLSAGTNITIVDNVISATGGGGGTVESAITSGSTNAVESKAIWSATTFNKNVLLTFDGYRRSTNYPEGCGKLVVEIGNFYGDSNIEFRNDDGRVLGIIHINNFGNISVDTSYFEGATYEISGTTVIINYPSTDITFVTVGETIWTYTAVVEGAWVNENTYMKVEVDGIVNGLQDNINSKLDATAYTPTVVDSALYTGSTNPVQNQALYPELRIDNGESETTLTFENSESTNYPNGCTKLIVEVVGSDNSSSIDFFNDDRHLGSIYINNDRRGIDVNISFDGASYEISGTTVIITYPTVTSVTKIRVNGSGNYVFKAIVALTTSLKDQVVANTTALGELSLVKLTQAEYDALVSKDSNTLYIISD